MARCGFSPGTIFGRVFFLSFFMMLMLLVIGGYRLYRHTFNILDHEAARRLSASAKLLADEIKSLELTDGRLAEKAIRKRFDKNQPWIQNIYWIRFTENSAGFLALASSSPDRRGNLLPPSIEEAEEMIYDEINDLSDGKVAFPSLYSMDDSRKYKIVLYPILDTDGMLESVIGVEADPEYLDLYVTFRKAFLQLTILAVVLALFAASTLSWNISGKISMILEDLKEISHGRLPETARTDIEELDILKNGILEMGRKIEERNLQVKKLYEDKLKELAITGSTLAHEIRNPLAAAQMHLGVIKRGYQPTENDLEHFREIDEQFIRLKNLVDRFLKYSRNVEIKPENIDLHKLLSKITEDFKLRGADFQLSLDFHEGFEVLADGSMLVQVFENLIKNTLEAAEERIAIIISAEYRSKHVRITFTDNGPGVKENLRETIFAPFVTGKPDGHGIGLALTRKILEAHGGEITLDKGYESGARFIIHLPHTS